MRITAKPIRRLRSLAPLSREHHQDLLFCWKIQQGLANGTSNERIFRYCKWFYENHLKDHFRREEDAFSNILSPDHIMMVRMLDDHRAIRMKFNALAENATNNGLARLARIIGCHVRFEEREMFNYIEQIASSEQLEALEREINHTRAKTEIWLDEFWIARR